MTTLAWPSLNILPQRADWNLIAVTQIHESPLTGAARTQALPGAYWQCVLDYSHARGADVRALWAFVARMQGRAGRVAVPTFGNLAPRGAGGGTPLVKGGGQEGTSLLVDGAPASTAGWLLEGDLFQVGEYVHMLTGIATTNGAGEATLQFFPELREVPADNAPITIRNCTTRMMFVADQQGTTYAPGPLAPFVLTLREAF